MACVSSFLSREVQNAVTLRHATTETEICVTPSRNCDQTPPLFHPHLFPLAASPGQQSIVVWFHRAMDRRHDRDARFVFRGGPQRAWGRRHVTLARGFRWALVHIALCSAVEPFFRRADRGWIGRGGTAVSMWTGKLY